MIPTSHRKQTNYTKTKANGTDATVFVWTKHTCTSDWRIRATRTVTADGVKNFTPLLRGLEFERIEHELNGRMGVAMVQPGAEAQFA